MRVTKLMLLVGVMMVSTAAFSESRPAGNSQRQNLGTGYYYFDRSGGQSKKSMKKHLAPRKAVPQARQCSCPCK